MFGIQCQISLQNKKSLLHLEYKSYKISAREKEMAWFQYKKRVDDCKLTKNKDKRSLGTFKK